MGVNLVMVTGLIVRVYIDMLYRWSGTSNSSSKTCGAAAPHTQIT